MESFKIKQASLEDFRIVNTLISNTGGPTLYKTTFGQFNVLSLIETSIISLIAVSNDNRNVPYAFISVNDIVSLSTEIEYESALKIIANYFPVNSMNTLFINFLVFDERTSNIQLASNELMKDLFRQLPTLEYLFWTIPQSFPITEFISNLFDVVDIFDEDHTTIDDKLMLMISREKILSKLLIREARIEDNDDLLPILYRNDSNITSDNNEFFLADIIQSKDNRKRLFVGVSNEKTVGLIATDLDININLITNIFNIDQYPNLIKDKDVKSMDDIGIIYLISDEVFQLNDFINYNDDRYIIIDRSIIYTYINKSDSKITSRLYEKCIHDIIINESNNRSKQITTVIIFGLPLNEDDINLISNTRFTYDIIIEIKSNKQSTNQSIDLLYKQLAHRNIIDNDFNSQSKVIWKKIYIDHISNDHDQMIQFIKDEYLSLLDKKLVKLSYDIKDRDTNNLIANAFAVISFCIDNEYSSRSQDILKGVFEDYMDYDYCFYLVPCNSVPSEVTRCMTRVPMRTGVNFDLVLYIYHRYTLLANDYLEVTRYTTDLSTKLENYITLDVRSNEFDKYLKASVRDNDIELQDNPNDVCFLAIIKDQVIGCITLSRESTTNEDTDLLRCNYHLDNNIDFSRHRGRSQAEITSYMISPLFSRWTRYIIKEIMRLYGKTLLFHHIREGLEPNKELLEELVPAKPRRMIQEEDGNKHPVVIEDEKPLYYITKRLLSARRTTINSRLLVVGHSMVSLVFLESILFHPHIYLPNVTIVLNNIPKAFEFSIQLKSNKSNDLNGRLSPYDADNPSYRETRACGYIQKCTIVNGKLTDIDRVNRSIVLSDEVVLEYDLLTLCCDVEDYTSRLYPTSKGMHPLQLAKRGIFGIGSFDSDERTIQWLKNNKDNESNIVITGFRYEVLNALGKIQSLNLGINPKRIHIFIKESFLVDLSNAFMNTVINDEINRCQYNIHVNTTIKDIQLDDKQSIKGIIYSDDFSKNNSTNLSCSTLITCFEKYIEKDIFTALHEAGLVYDGGLVVDENFRTNDPSIFAGGDFTRFSRIHGNIPRHNKYNGRDIGRLLALAVINQHIDPLLSNTLKSKNKEARRHILNELPELPKLQLPKSITYTLPGNLKLFHSTAISKSLESISMVTGDVESDNICTIEVDYLGSIIEFICLTKVSIEERNLTSIVGLHENFLNSAIYSYDQGLVSNWISFLREDWARMLYHDRFHDLIKTIENQLHNDKGYIFIIDKILETADNTLDDNNISVVRRKLLGERCETLSETSIITIENAVLEFIRENRVSLPKYYITQNSNK